MAVELDHTIVHATDPAASAGFLTDVLGLAPPVRTSAFHAVALPDGVTLDYARRRGGVTSQHYAFLVGDAEFDQALARIEERGIAYDADPSGRRPGEITTRDGGRGLYFDDPDGHRLEILTVPYGGWPDGERPRRTITGADVGRYVESVTTAEAPLLAEVAATTRERFPSRAGMMVGQVEGALLATLVAISRPRLVVEVGTFTGYSSLAMAAALPDGGRIVTCDVDPDHAALAQRHLEASPYADRVELRVGPALETLATIEGPVDMAFVDADKTGYPAYVDALLPMLTDHGFVVLDNVLWRGRVADEPSAADDEETTALRDLNARLAAADGLDVVVLPIRDGVSILRRRG